MVFDQLEHGLVQFLANSLHQHHMSDLSFLVNRERYFDGTLLQAVFGPGQILLYP